MQILTLSPRPGDISPTPTETPLISFDVPQPDVYLFVFPKQGTLKVISAFSSRQKFVPLLGLLDPLHFVPCMEIFITSFEVPSGQALLVRNRWHPQGQLN